MTSDKNILFDDFELYPILGSLRIPARLQTCDQGASIQGIGTLHTTTENERQDQN